MIRIIGVIDQMIQDEKIRKYRIDRKKVVVDPVNKTSQYSNHTKQHKGQKMSQENYSFAKILKKKTK